MQAINHRPGSRKEKAHQFVDANPNMERKKAISEIVRRHKVKESTATTWYHTFRKLSVGAKKAPVAKKKAPAATKAPTKKKAPATAKPAADAAATK